MAIHSSRRTNMARRVFLLHLPLRIFVLFASLFVSNTLAIACTSLSHHDAQFDSGEKNLLPSKERMGISKVMGCVSTVLFSASFYLKHIGCTYMAIPLLYVGSVGFTIAIASLPAINATSILGKNSNGNFPFWSKVIFGPYLASVKLYVVLKRLKRKESLFDEVSEGLYVGGWPTSRSRLPLGDPALIDCTCELPRSYFVPTGAYLCIPLWDTRSPGPGDIEAAVRWACKRTSENKPIYIHCANGHGRSVCVMCAILVDLGLAESWKDAEKMVREKRPLIRMNAQHRKNLEEWSKLRNSSKKG